MFFSGLDIGQLSAPVSRVVSFYAGARSVLRFLLMRCCEQMNDDDEEASSGSQANATTEQRRCADCE